MRIGDRVLLGPAVQLYPGAWSAVGVWRRWAVRRRCLPHSTRATDACRAVGHDVDPAARSGVHGLEHAKPIVIGDDCWIGGGAIIM